MYVFFSESECYHNAWLNALDFAVVGSRLRVDDCQDRGIGWRHKIMRTTIYSAVCCGDVEMLDKVGTCVFYQQFAC